MNWVNKIGQIVTKIFLFLPCFYTFTNYFYVLKEEQRTTLMGIFFLAVSIIYFLTCLYFLIVNWGK
ncbi:MAG: hypothetical protein MRERV_2c048 [Mycoplasmataceae bacterium RV_VA103A]|nr:MAG: hypothetical protein MRERV_2c048 [Mycoplasmataceae bacterium RV_VA103A]